MFVGTCFNYRSRGLPRPFFPDIAPSRIITTNSLWLIVFPIHEWSLFFKIFKSKLSSFALFKRIHHSLFYLPNLFVTFFFGTFQMHLRPPLHPSLRPPLHASTFTVSDKIFDYHEDGGKRLLRNMDNKLPINTASYLKALLSASTKLWKFHTIQIYSYSYPNTSLNVIINP